MIFYCEEWKKPDSNTLLKRVLIGIISTSQKTISYLAKRLNILRTQSECFFTNLGLQKLNITTLASQNSTFFKTQEIEYTMFKKH